MRKIFCYELRRLLWNRFFLGIALALLFYGWQVLGGVTILGVSHTAPFSPWSFGDYLSRMLPLLWIGALFFLTFFTSDKARRAAVLTNATQMPLCWGPDCWRFAVWQRPPCSTSNILTGTSGKPC